MKKIYLFIGKYCNKSIDKFLKYQQNSINPYSIEKDFCNNDYPTIQRQKIFGMIKDFNIGIYSRVLTTCSPYLRKSNYIFTIEGNLIVKFFISIIVNILKKERLKILIILMILLIILF